MTPSRDLSREVKLNEARDLKVLTLCVIQGHIDQSVEEGILVHLSTPTKTHSLASHHGNTPEEILIFQVAKRLVVPIGTINMSHDIHCSWIVVGHISYLVEPTIDGRNPNGPHR